MKDLSTLGDIGREVDSLLEVDALRIVGGTYYPVIGGLIFGLVSGDGSRAGEALCALPNGWVGASHYSRPPETGPVENHRSLRLTAVSGSGRLALPIEDLSFHFGEAEAGSVDLYAAWGEWESVHVINEQDEGLFVVRAAVNHHPDLRVDVNPHHDRLLDETNDSVAIIAPEISYDQMFGQNGRVTFVTE